ncbi:MAG: aromatic amino acid lyase, partial [Gaiellaceae bacterium]
MSVFLDGRSLTVRQVVAVARGAQRVELAPAAVERMRETRAVVERSLERGDVVYGMTTGVGARKKVGVPPEEAEAFNRALVSNHLVGAGPDAPPEVVRATMLRLVNALASGTPGARPEIADRLVAALNAGEHPRVRLLGSVGQADLPAMADLAHGLFSDVELQAKEALALLNSNAFSTGTAALAVADLERLLEALDVAGALDLEAFGANLTLLHPAIGEVRPYPGLVESLERLHG